MNWRCWLYNRLESARRNRLVTQLIYGGMPVSVGPPLEIRGTVQTVPRRETDGDCTFDVKDDFGTVWHCEATVCYPDVQAIARSLGTGWRVRVGGLKRIDPAHMGGPMHLEIHPVYTIVRI